MAIAGPAAASRTPALRAAITELADGVTVTADAPTNSLVIQATKDGFNTLSQVIQQLDIPRPQVLVEALIMEVDVTDNETLGFNGLARIFRGNTSYAVGSLTGTGRGAVVGSFPTAPTTTTTPGGDGEDDATTTTTTAVDGFTGSASEVIGDLAGTALGGLVAAASRNTLAFDPVTGAIAGGSLIQGLINATADLGGTNILSAPHILTVDNEEAEIKVGNNIPIVTSRVESAAGQDTGLATSQNIERQDIGITLRVTPQISEGDNLRLQIFQEITNVNEGLSAVTGDPQEVGVALSNRTIQNTVVVGDNETVVIGGLISDNYSDTESKVPWIGDIPILGWAFKTVTKRATKENLLVFLTPRIVRNEQQLAAATIRKREEFWDTSEGALRLTKKEKEAAKTRRQEAINAGIPLSTYRGRNPVRGRLVEHRDRYPVDQMLEIERREEAREQEVNAARAEIDAMRFGILAATFGDEGAAASTLQQLIDAGYDGSMVAEATAPARCSTRSTSGPSRIASRPKPRPRCFARPSSLRPPSRWRATSDPSPPHGRARVTAVDERLGLREVLLRTTPLTLEQLEEAVRTQRDRGGRLTDHLLSLGFLTEDQVLTAVGTQLGLDVRPSLTADDVDLSLIEKLPIAFAKSHGLLIPISQAGRRTPCRTSRSRTRSTRRRTRRPAPAVRRRRGRDRARQRAGGSSSRPSTRSTTAAPTHSITDIVEDAARRLRSRSRARSAAEPQDLLDVRRRGADHPPRGLAAPAGRQGARERHPHRAVREGDPRPLPGRQHALRAGEPRCRRRCCRRIVVAHQDPGGLDIAEKRVAPGRPDPAEDRRPRLRRAPVDGAGRAWRTPRDALAAPHHRDARPRDASGSRRRTSSTSGRS